MRFIAFKKDIDTTSNEKPSSSGFFVDDSVSVIQHKKHFFDALRNIGELIAIDEKINHKEATELFSRPDVIFAQMHNVSEVPNWDDIPKRRLCHSLGDFLLPPIFLEPNAFSVNTINLVTSKFQQTALEKHLGPAAPKTAVFTPKLNETSFYPPDKKQRAAARKALAIKEQDIHIVYAGRWLATKGICQLARVLNLWPNKNIKISLVGNFTPGFSIQISSTSHLTFENYFKREFLTRDKNMQISLLPGRNPDELRNLLWSADSFVYASGHEDENFGMSPREAILCGLPVVVTDFCGLHDVGKIMPWGPISTYPSFAGVRYSLKHFQELIKASITQKGWDKKEAMRMVKKECDLSLSENNLKYAAEKLLKIPLEKPRYDKTAREELMFNIIRYGTEPLAAAIMGKEENFIDGGYVDGTGTYNKEFSQRKLLQAIQGIYTTQDKALQVTSKSLLRGFFRIGLWKEEKAVVEFGFPGPRVKYYDDKDWKALVSCFKYDKSDDLVAQPLTAEQTRLMQELIDLGYLVPDK